jgi:DNA-binding transcriptional ArsR family regulator
MESSKSVIRALGALAHETRLEIFRMLVQAGPQGLPVGSIGERLGLPAATLSFHLAALRHAGLVLARRDGRSLYQVTDYATMNGVLSYLSENCCQGEDCGVACAPSGKPAKSTEETAHEKTARPRGRRRAR